ncbi:hypothetical protein AO735_18210 [Pseudomonas sp. TTU2014-096BSC]|nr:hypothetical protein AO735_18210 [Pseudomonas sp. TTU2014-096BSC]
MSCGTWSLETGCIGQTRERLAFPLIRKETSTVLDGLGCCVMSTATNFIIQFGGDLYRPIV